MMKCEKRHYRVTGQAGTSALAFLVASLIIVMTFMAMIHFYRYFGYQLYRDEQRMAAQRLAFAQLDIYPERMPYDAKQGSVQLVVISQHDTCQLVKVIVHLANQKPITQQRWCCKI